MMFVISLSLFVILLAPLTVMSASVSLNNLVWVKTCVGLQYRRGLPSPLTVAKKVVNSIRSALRAKSIETLRDRNDMEYLKQGHPELYYETSTSHTGQHNKCLGFFLNIPLPESMYQKLVLSGRADSRSGEELTPEQPLILDADAKGKYIDTITDYVRGLLKDL